MTMTIGQLSFDIKPLRDPERLHIAGSLRIADALSIPCDLNHGDMLLVQVSGPDGEILTTAEFAVAAPPSFIPIEDKDIGLIGYERAHKAKLT